MAWTEKRPVEYRISTAMLISGFWIALAPELSFADAGVTCRWMMLSRKSGLRLRQRRCPRRRDWLRVFTCSWTCGGGRRGGPLKKKKKKITGVTMQLYQSCTLLWNSNYWFILLWIQTGELGKEKTVALRDGLFGGSCSQVALKGQDLLFLSLRDLQLPVDHLRLCVLVSDGAWRVGVVTEERKREREINGWTRQRMR